METDTIAAIATAPGQGGIGIVRVSGPLAPVVARRLFPSLRPPWRSHRVRQGTLVDLATGQVIDKAVVILMRGPRSYTGEDVCEIHCHGNPLVLDRVLSACLAAGCRPARAGEFTLRAFLNEKLDLSQAEAVLDVVRARTNLDLRVAIRQLEGRLTGRVEPLREELMALLAQAEAMVDFVEDDIPARPPDQMRALLVDSLVTLDDLLRNAEQGVVLRQGASLTIVGSPNVGKSSLMNALLGMDRAIVTPVAGTTRDTVEETVDIGGIPFRTVDTAGITDSSDPVERIGVERSREAMRAADIVLLVLDRSRPPLAHDTLAIEAVRALGDSPDVAAPRVVVALNKCDLPPVHDHSDALHSIPATTVVETAAVAPGGIDQLRDALAATAVGPRREEWITGSVRHVEALRRTHGSLEAALAGLDAGTPLDLLAFDIRSAAAALGEITGVAVDDELLDRIFREFCIGK